MFTVGLSKIAETHIMHGLGVAAKSVKNKAAQVGKHLHRYRRDYILGAAASGSVASAVAAHKKTAGYSEALGGVGKGIISGLKGAGKETIQEALTLKGGRDAYKGFREATKGKGAKHVFQTAEGGQALGHAIGKSLPSAAVAGTGVGLAAKAYKKLRDDTNNSYDKAQDSQYYYR